MVFAAELVFAYIGGVVCKASRLSTKPPSTDGLSRTSSTETCITSVEAMSEESKARQHAANAQADNRTDVDRTHHVGVPRSEEIVSP